MTMDEIRASDKAYLIPTEIAGILRCDPHYIRVGARDGTLPFRYVLCGCRVKIPRAAFIAWMDGQEDAEK